MTTCAVCKKPTIEKIGTMPDGIEYKYFYCHNCGEEYLDMAQLHEVANKYRQMKRFNAKVSKWGMSLGVRIPKELAQKYKLKHNSTVTFIPEKDGIKLMLI